MQHTAAKPVQLSQLGGGRRQAAREIPLITSCESIWRGVVRKPVSPAHELLSWRQAAGQMLLACASKRSRAIARGFCFFGRAEELSPPPPMKAAGAPRGKSSSSSKAAGEKAHVRTCPEHICIISYTEARLGRCVKHSRRLLIQPCEASDTRTSRIPRALHIELLFTQAAEATAQASSRPSNSSPTAHCNSRAR